MEDCVALARKSGQEIWARCQIPVYLYEEAALRPERKRLEGVRNGEFEYLCGEVMRNTDRAPDIGGPAPDPSPGAAAVSAPKFLVALNMKFVTPATPIPQP